MLRALLAAMFIAAAPAVAFAHSCPSLMAEIDAALPAATISDDDKAKVADLRARGEELHGAGDHDGSMAALEEAKGLLGL